MKWLRDQESRVPHAYARAAHVLVRMRAVFPFIRCAEGR